MINFFVGAFVLLFLISIIALIMINSDNGLKKFFKLSKKMLLISDFFVGGFSLFGAVLISDNFKKIIMIFFLVCFIIFFIINIIHILLQKFSNDNSKENLECLELAILINIIIHLLEFLGILYACINFTFKGIMIIFLVVIFINILLDLSGINDEICS